MSSHHIIREKQEPALYIHEMVDFPPEYLGQLLEWSPTLISSASVYEHLQSMGLKVDIVCSEEGGVELQEHTRLWTFPELQLAQVVQKLIEEQYNAVHILSQEMKFDDLADFLPEISIVLFTSSTKNYAIRPGFSIWKPKGSLFYIDIICYFETDNLKQQEGALFEVIEDGFVRFDFSEPFLFIGEPL